MIWNDPFIIEQSTRIAQCYAATTGQSLFSRLSLPVTLTALELSQALYHAPVAILSHDVNWQEGARVNLYNYANATALRLFERSFAEQTQLASKQSAASVKQAQGQRNSLLAECLAKGWVQFSTERLSATGKTVVLKDAILFNLCDSAGIYAGQAVVFDPKAEQ